MCHCLQTTLTYGFIESGFVSFVVCEPASVPVCVSHVLLLTVSKWCPAVSVLLALSFDCCAFLLAALL